MNKEFPTSDMELTHILVVNNMKKSRQFYSDILGATVIREYGGTSCVLNFQGSWLLLVTDGEPTPDKPTVTFASPLDPDIISHAMTIRVPDCQASYQILKSRGADFLTPPVNRGAEIRCFFRDPDGHLLEISQVS
jgi:catechol 2,3-dioxygenase-like lactoylglutathione lyase family enzyme